MNEVDAHPQRVVLLQHLRQRRRYALRQYDGNFRADAKELDVRNLPEARQQPLESIIGEEQRITARQQHVANHGRSGNVVDRSLPLAGAEFVGPVMRPDDARAGAVAAVDRAGSRSEEQHAIRQTTREFVQFYVDNFDTIAEQAKFVPMTDEQAQKSQDAVAQLAG